MTLDVRVLGPVSASRDGAPLHLGGGNPKGVLAMLVIARGAAVPVQSLVEAIWDASRSADAVGSLRVVVSGLRRQFGEAIETVGPGYRLVLAPGESDLDRFRVARDAGRASASARDAAAHYRRALAEYHGAPLSDLRGARFADDLATGLDEERLLCVEACLDAELRGWRHADVLAELGELTVAHPLREGLWALYMTALYRSGRQAHALAAYQSLRRTLGSELGIEPGPQLRALNDAILRQDPALLGSATPASTETVAERVPDRAWLQLADGGRVDVDRGRVRLGRGGENAVVVDDPLASRAHAAIAYAGGRFVLADLGSTNGTRVNGADLLGTHELADGDRIQIGGVEIVFRRDGN